MARQKRSYSVYFHLFVLYLELSGLKITYLYLASGKAVNAITVTNYLLFCSARELGVLNTTTKSQFDVEIKSK
jgi:hypothetical protein